jgi:hypothetical protein
MRASGWKRGCMVLAGAFALAGCAEQAADDAEQPSGDAARVAAPKPGSAPAQGVAPPPAAPDAFDQLLRMLDTDRDGRIAASEHRRGASDMFRRMDTDRDGKVTVVEMDAVRRGLDDAEGASRERLREVDADGDGVLSEAEHLAATRVVFDASDANGDGYLQRDEPVRSQRPGKP